MREAFYRGFISALFVMVLFLVSSAGVSAQTNPTLFLVDSQFSDLRTVIFRVDPVTGALEVRADLGVTYSPMLGLAAASGTVLYLSATDTGPSNVCQGDFACLLLKVELDPLSTTPVLVQVIGTIQEEGSMLAGVTGLTFRRDGKLYAISQNTSGLYLLDPVTAAATRIGTMDLELHGGDLTFDGSDRLWLWTNIGEGTGLYQADPVTCHASAFDLHPFLDMSGLAALGHGDSLRTASPVDDQLYEVDPVIGFTGSSALLTLNGVRFDHRRGDLDSPFCEGDDACADENPCTSDVCSPGGCLHTPADRPLHRRPPAGAGIFEMRKMMMSDEIPCDDGNPCTQIDSCQSGICAGSSPVVCTAPDACHDAGICNPSSGACEDAPAKADGTSCDDGNLCTMNEACQGGICQGGSPRDLDGDGHVDSICGGNDCTDLNPLVWSVPFEVTHLTLDTASPAGLAWDSQAFLAGSGTTYDLVSGQIRGNLGFSFTPNTCLQAGGGPSYSDNRPEPDSTEGFWYLARGTNACGVGTFGSIQRNESLVPCP